MTTLFVNFGIVSGHIHGAGWFKILKHRMKENFDCISK